MMILKDKNCCTGCTACAMVCPVQAILMEQDCEGFFYPKFIPTICIGCGLCKKICPLINDLTFTNPISVFAVKNINEEIRSKSTSGGLFTAISDYVLSIEGVIYGACFDSLYKVNHIRSVEEKTRNKMRGSKYVQSFLGDIFIQVKKDLNEGKFVLFSGTPCQIAGLKKFLNRDFPNIIFLDFVCYGVPTPIIFEKFISFLYKKYSCKIKKYYFRNKSESWRNGKTFIELDSGEVVSKEVSSIFDMLFWSGNIIRPSCYNCKYSKSKRVSDITMGDFWGIEKISFDFDDDKGISLCIINSPKGFEIFNKIKKYIEYIEVNDGNNWLQPRLMFPTNKPSSREEFWKYYNKNGFDYIVNKYTDYRISKIIIRKIKEFIRRFINGDNYVSKVIRYVSKKKIK